MHVMLAVMRGSFTWLGEGSLQLMHLMLAIMAVFLPGWARNAAADAHDARRDIQLRTWFRHEGSS